MADRDITLKIDAKPVGDVGKPFADLGQKAKAADSSLKSMGREIGGVHKNLGQLQAGLLSLSTSVNILPDSVGKAVLSLNALGGAASTLKGLGGMLATPGGAGVAAAGAAFALVAMEIDRIDEAAIKSTESVKSLIEELKKAHDISISFGGQRRALEEQIAGQRDVAAGLRRHPGDELAQQEFATLRALERARAESSAADLAAETVGGRALAAPDVRTQIKYEEAQLKARNKAIEENQSWLTGPGIFARTATGKEREDTLYRERYESEQRLKSLNAELASDKELADTIERQQQAKTRLAQTEQKLADLSHKRRQAEIDNLRTLKETVAEQARLSGEKLKELEASLKSSKTSLALMEPDERRDILDISRRAKAGKQLTVEDLKKIQGLGIAGEAFDKGVAGIAAAPDIQEIIKNFGQQQRIDDAKWQQEAFERLGDKLGEDIANAIQEDAKLLADAIERSIAPLTEANKNLDTHMMMLIAQATNGVALGKDSITVLREIAAAGQSPDALKMAKAARQAVGF